MIVDNTGLSTGLHTHMDLNCVEYTNASNANGSFDPSLFFTGDYAVTSPTTPRC
jgi:hypothetical protein